MACVVACVLAHALAESESAPPARRQRSGGETRRGGGERPLRCGGCAASFEPHAWLALPLVAVLAGEAIASHVIKWPLGVRIEIRRCLRCGRSMARTTEP